MEATDVLGALRRRWRIPLFVFIVAALVMTALLVRAPEASTKFLSTATINLPIVPSDQSKRTEAVGTEAPDVVEGDGFFQTNLALKPEVLRAGFDAAGIPQKERAAITVEVVANDRLGTLRYIVTTAAAADAEAVARSMATSFIAYRQSLIDTDVAGAKATGLALVQRLNDLIGPLNAALESALAAYPLQVNANDPEGPPIRPSLPLELRLQTSERDAVAVRLAEAEAAYSEAVGRGLIPDPFAELADSSEARQTIDSGWPVLVPGLVLVAVALLVGVGGAVVADQSDTGVRGSANIVRTFRAPILGAVPRSRRHDTDPAVLTDGSSVRGTAYRSLAATALATDRMPPAIVVTSPLDDCQLEVAVNFAAGLADHGTRALLIGTNPEHDKAFAAIGAVNGSAVTLRELLERAGSGELFGLIDALEPSPLHHRLLVVPSGCENGERLALENLPQLLSTVVMARSQVAVIVAPPFMSDPDATIIARAVRHVLWTISSGAVPQGVAEAAVSRLELTDVHPFGIAVFGTHT